MSLPPLGEPAGEGAGRASRAPPQDGVTPGRRRVALMCEVRGTPAAVPHTDRGGGLVFLLSIFRPSAAV